MLPDCWHYLGSKDRRFGYGKYRGTGVHRLAYEMWIGPLGGLMALHKCDYPPCFNPKHLFKGTARDNTLDMVKKGRLHYGVSCGEKNGQSKLTAESVREIRRRFIPRVHTLEMLAKEYSVAYGTVVKVVYGGTWKSAGKEI